MGLGLLKNVVEGSISNSRFTAKYRASAKRVRWEVYPVTMPVIQAMSGLMSINGEENSTPLRIGIPIVDIACGLYASVWHSYGAQRACKFWRRPTLSTSRFSIQRLSILHPHAANYLMSEVDPGSFG